MQCANIQSFFINVLCVCVHVRARSCVRVCVCARAVLCIAFWFFVVSADLIGRTVKGVGFRPFVCWGLRVRIQPGSWYLSFVSVVCFPVVLDHSTGRVYRARARRWVWSSKTVICTHTMSRQKEVTTKKKERNFSNIILFRIINNPLYLMFKYDSLCSCACLHYNVQRRPAVNVFGQSSGSCLSLFPPRYIRPQFLSFAWACPVVSP
jgi:hypothetical protein